MITEENKKMIFDKKYKYIFFDIFDTILKRKVEPEFTKKIWSNHIVKRFNLNISIIELYNLRNALETKLGAMSKEDYEFKYNDLIKAIHKELNLKIPFSEFLDICVDIEVEIESSVLIPNSNVLDIIKELNKASKKVYCVSDMYLSKDMLTKIFTNLGIIKYFDDIFVSCEYLKNKKSGKLYDIVLKTIKAKTSECLMIGDNKSSDYEIPKSKGIDSINIDSSKNYKFYQEYASNNNEDIALKKFNKLKSTSTDNFEHTIFTLYNFTEKLYYSLLEKGLDEVFFLSREGEYLKKLFDKYQETIYGKKIKSHYIIVSRKSTYLPSLKELDKEDFGVLLKQYVNSSLIEFLSSLNFTKEEQEKILNSFSKDCKKVLKNTKDLTDYEKEVIINISDSEYKNKIYNLYESKALKYLKENKEFKTLYESKRSNQKELFIKYIESFTKSKTICVVDIGWNGSIQDNIQNILGNKYKVIGYLYGLATRNNPKEIAKQDNKWGLIFSNVPSESSNYELFMENRTIYEIILGASHGSANNYVLKNNKVEVTTFSKDEEIKIYKNIISKLQNKMMKTFEELTLLFANGYYDNHKMNKMINKLHFDMLFKPTKEQIKFFNKLYHYENFGVFEFTDFKLKRKNNIKYYIKENAKYFLRNKTFFYDAFWPTLKLYNEKLFIPRMFYRRKIRKVLKNREVI